MTETASRQIYELGCSHRRGIHYLVEMLARFDQHQADAQHVSYRRDKWIVTVFGFPAGMLVIATGYPASEARRNREMTKAVNGGNAVVPVVGEWYAINDKNPGSNGPCHEFLVSKGILSYMNDRPSKVEPQPVARFTIPGGCEPR